MEVDLAECPARLASLFEVDKALPRAMTTNYELFTTPLRFIQVSYCEGHCFTLNLNSGNVHRLKQWFARYNLGSTLMYYSFCTATGPHATEQEFNAKESTFSH